MGSYNLSIKTSAAKEILAVGQKKDRQRIIARIRSLAEEPRPPGCEKLTGRADAYRIRIGDYRVVYSIQDDPPAVTVFRVGHRSDVYR